GVDRRLTARELDDLGIALGADEAVQDVLDLIERKAEALARVGEAQWALHVAGAVDLDDAEAGVLLVVKAQAAVVRAALFNPTDKSRWNAAWLVDTGLTCICLGISIDQRLGASVRGATLAHEHLAFTEHDVGVDRPPTLWADAARQLVEDVIGISSTRLL